jgi:hypothetical protein
MVDLIAEIAFEELPGCGRDLSLENSDGSSPGGLTGASLASAMARSLSAGQTRLDRSMRTSRARCWLLHMISWVDGQIVRELACAPTGARTCITSTRGPGGMINNPGEMVQVEQGQHDRKRSAAAGPPATGVALGASGAR